VTPATEADHDPAFRTARPSRRSRAVTENTLDGVRAALAIGVTSLELDVAMTADGALVVVHDPVLNPDLVRAADGNWLAAPGPAVRALRLAELAIYDVGRAQPGSGVAQANPRQQAFDGARIPTLDAVFEATAAAGVVVDVELKTDPRHPGLSAPPADLAEAVVVSARRCEALDRLAVRSFDWRGLLHLRVLGPLAKLGWLTAAWTASAAWRGEFAVPVRSVPASVAAAAGGKTDRACWAPHLTEVDAAAIAEAHDLRLRVRRLQRRTFTSRMPRWRP